MRRLIWITLMAAAGCGNGTGGGGGGSSSLAGTWELSSANASTKGTLVLSSSRLTVTFNGTEFDLQVGSSPSLMWTSNNEAPGITVSHTASDIDFGALPIGLGGDWMIHGPHNASCIGSVRADAITGGCNGVGQVPGGLPSLNRQIQIMRTTTLDSIFGALGGTWALTDDKGGTCNATFSGSTLSAKCQGSNVGGGQSVTITFSNGLASGITSGGLEFTARRL